MKHYKQLLIASIIIITFSYCSENSEIKEEEEEETTYAAVAPFYPIDFEIMGFGSDWIWNIFENGKNNTLEIADNPDTSGINNSAKVAKFTALKAGEMYAGCETKHGEGIGSFRFDSTNSIVKILVYKTSISDVALKFAEYAAPGQGAEAQPPVKVANTKINEWEELTFDLSGSIGKGATLIIDQIIIFPDWTSRTSDTIIYFDNITFGSN
jgi:hypothetical protein